MLTGSVSDLLAQHQFVRFWLARLSGTTAMQMLMVALGWQIYDITSGAWDLGLVGLFQFVPALLLTLLSDALALAVTGAADSISVVTRTTLVQLETPDEMRGRVGAVNSIFIGTSNQLGEFESGATAALLGPVASVVLGGIGTLLVAALWLRLFPALAQRDRML